ncbi:hypothetical protein [Lactiplantibacillus pentosus]|uniref:hypothetical protein n=1 Tax=Lactiplantibacillus pentosus TaxID=1589 RepID=UPI0021A7E884|nr:hypothetical protein [Lactiplantibacillus pentosus]MCT3065017.1 hypothetical protein [Lactiplantibacillus pentosus]
MSNLSSDEKAYNEWWMGRFDEKHYKIIRLFDHEKRCRHIPPQIRDIVTKKTLRLHFLPLIGSVWMSRV